MENVMRINISIDLPDAAPKNATVAAIRDAAERAAGQIEYDILNYPFAVDEQIQLGSDVQGVDDVYLYRSE